jgi:hypothetical protein
MVFESLESNETLMLDQTIQCFCGCVLLFESRSRIKSLPDSDYDLVLAYCDFSKEQLRY